MTYVFNTVKGAAIFVSSVHIYNGLGMMTQFIAFPVIFSATSKLEKGADVEMYQYLPGLLYAVFYLALGIIIFKGIESESIAMIKVPALSFAVIQIVFIVVRGMVGIFPIPIMMADLSQSEKPTHWNVYKSIQFFVLTILGGVVYFCVLFLYLQQLAGPNSDIKGIICISNTKGEKGSSNPCGCGNKENVVVSQTQMASSHSSSPKNVKLQHNNPSSKQQQHKSQQDESQGQQQKMFNHQQQQPSNITPNPMLFYSASVRY